MGIITIISAVLLFIEAVVECINMIEHGTPAKDSDILEMLENNKDYFDTDKKWNDKFRLYTSYRSSAPSIHQTQYSIIFPYYIDDVGVVPIWYKSAGRIRKIFEEKISASKYEVTKRDKLGLNKK